jgi:glutathione synthase/RimK-type ligase-like ATP-grasp enzyme
MKILILGTSSEDNGAEEYYQKYADLFQDAAGRTDTEVGVYTAFLDDLIISVGVSEWSIHDARNDADLSEYTAVILRGTGFRQLFDVLRAISSYGKRHSVEIINDYSTAYNSSKLAQAVYFAEQNLPVAQTVYVTSAVFRNAGRLPFQFPCIMKAVFGAHGSDNHVVHSLEEAQAIFEAQPATRFVLQDFVPNEGDWRVLVIGNEVLVIGRKAVEGSHLNNTSKGGSATLIDHASLPAGVLDDARKAAKGLGMTIAGVDVITHKETGKYYFLEVNSQPQLMSGAFVEEKTKLLATLLQRIAAGN